MPASKAKLMAVIACAQVTSPSAVVSHRQWTFAAAVLLAASLIMASIASSAQAAAVPLGTAANFEVLAGSTVTNAGPSVISGGNAGVSPGSAVTGFGPGVVIAPSTIYRAGSIALLAKNDLTTAYNNVAGRSSSETIFADLAGRTLAPGVYSAGSSLALNGDLTLDANGDPNAVFVFQAGTSLLVGTTTTSHIRLINGAQANNVFWQVGSSATIGVGSRFAGNILALTSITMQTNATLNGRALARNGAVTLETTTLTTPAPAADAASASAALGVIAQPGGWLAYTHLMVASLTLGNATTTTIAGEMDADGTCHSASSGVVGPGSPDTYQEQVGFNPSTCQERILSGTLSASDAALLNAVPADANPLMTPTYGDGVADPTSATTNNAASRTGTVTNRAAASYSSAHVKTSWIDPVFITITSLSANLKWPLYGAGGTLTGRVNPYAFKFDGWSSTGPSRITFPSLPGNAGWSLPVTDRFTNNDFAAAVYILLGPTGWAAAERAPGRRTA